MDINGEMAQCSQLRTRRSWSTFARARAEGSADASMEQEAALWEVYEREVLPEVHAAVMAAHRGLCAYCAGPATGPLDYLVPPARGGEPLPHNLVAACLSCQASRHNTHLDVWLAQRPDLDAGAVRRRIAIAAAALRPPRAV